MVGTASPCRLCETRSDRRLSSHRITRGFMTKGGSSTPSRRIRALGSLATHGGRISSLTSLGLVSYRGPPNVQTSATYIEASCFNNSSAPIAIEFENLLLQWTDQNTICKIAPSRGHRFRFDVELLDALHGYAVFGHRAAMRARRHEDAPDILCVIARFGQSSTVRMASACVDVDCGHGGQMGEIRSKRWTSML